MGGGGSLWRGDRNIRKPPGIINQRFILWSNKKYPNEATPLNKVKKSKIKNRNGKQKDLNKTVASKRNAPEMKIQECPTEKNQSLSHKSKIISVLFPEGFYFHT